jgi:hypothetical protein
MFDDSNIVESVRVMSSQMLYVTYKKDEEFVEAMSHTNPVIAAFTTAICRLRLYSELEKLQDRICYFDTDSIIYVTRPTDTYQPEIGAFLGDMTNELSDFGEGAYIDEFVSGGPKNYSYRVQKADGTSTSKIKIRGFTLSHHTAAHLNRENLKKKVFRFVKEGTVSKTPIVFPQIARTAEREIVTKDVMKEYGVTYDKRWVLPDFNTLPYGTCDL